MPVPGNGAKSINQAHYRVAGSKLLDRRADGTRSLPEPAVGAPKSTRGLRLAAGRRSPLSPGRAGVATDTPISVWFVRQQRAAHERASLPRVQCAETKVVRQGVPRWEA
jgi:hypothetical protein